MAFRIISLDSQGINGIYTAVLLDRLAQETKGFIQSADVIAGGALGGITALGLAAGRSTQEMVGLYQQNAASVLHRSVFCQVSSLWGLLKSRHNNTELRRILDAVFGLKRLRDLTKRVVVPTYLLNDLSGTGLDRRPFDWHTLSPVDAIQDAKLARKKRWWLRLREKNGKVNEMPCHHKLEEYLDTYIKAAGIEGDRKGPLFRAAIGKTKKLGQCAISRTDVWYMVRRRAADAGIEPAIGCHTFRATGITDYLTNGGRIEVGQKMAGHSNDRRNDDISVGEVERIGI